jgi:uncharacterized membrane protein YeaQ/YmgE (transglycosylase-associated protein family)
LVIGAFSLGRDLLGVIAGLSAGWMAEAISRAGGYGLITDMVLGLVGSLVGGAAVWVLVSTDAGMPGMFLMGFASATLAIVAQRGLWRSSRLGT